jgi:hypothetical protein
MLFYFFCSGIDFTPPAKAGLVFAETTPVVVVLHGVCGGAPIETDEVPALSFPDISENRLAISLSP